MSRARASLTPSQWTDLFAPLNMEKREGGFETTSMRSEALTCLLLWRGVNQRTLRDFRQELLDALPDEPLEEGPFLQLVARFLNEREAAEKEGGPPGDRDPIESPEEEGDSP